ncbi:Bax inhibitor 1-related [Kalmanozyma brasiliensis GHG001]|uniref:N-methyl-D-aspartate receptor glutamate-binding subunit n=1 Tax=Kalmanozyma brasiliensis (strain GHG001) TaxID=1365824 RepID=V5EMG5_KALBG|nr:Bax inhibitor 1-related [Kalmanozyma brasiliensis GHG001]EST06330.1 Bax inhibitor 1-related [Kalmanozyma brasiliensis GHG001]
MSSSYPAAPPSYTAPKGYQPVPTHDTPAPTYGAADPTAPRNVEEEGDPDDFKFGVTVEQSSPEIRAMFLRKVYSVLFFQILGTTVIAGVMTTQGIASWVQANQWAFIVPMIGSLVTMGFLYFKRHSHPTNIILLSLFTVLESISLGTVITYVDQKIVLQAMVITAFTFGGLTLFTLQSKWDFSSLGGWLFGGLMVLVGVGFVGVFLPYNQTFDLIMAGAGCVIFSLYIVYDTWLIQRRLSAEEWVLANLSLYLDIVNLFINILRILNNQSRD